MTRLHSHNAASTLLLELVFTRRLRSDLHGYCGTYAALGRPLMSSSSVSKRELCDSTYTGRIDVNTPS